MMYKSEGFGLRLGFNVSVSMEVCVRLYSVGWCHICSGL